MQKLTLTKYNFTLEAVEAISLPAYKGSTFHGGFGHALMKMSPRWYQYFFEPGEGKQGDWPKPFVLLPPLDLLEHYPQGHQFSCQLTLFGEAVKHHAFAEAAIEFLGNEMGLGYQLGKFKVLEVTQSTPKPREYKAKQQANIKLITRLRLKNNNRLQRVTPDFTLFMTRLIGRLKTIEQTYMQHPPDLAYYDELIQQASHIKTSKNAVTWDDWARFSGTQKKWMKFGGLLGEVAYEGDLTTFQDVLEIGEWLHIGGKTSFGLGKYELTYQGDEK